MADNVPVATSLTDVYTQDAIPSQTKRWKQLLSTFQNNYSSPASFVARSPGRVNIIGEHIDYSLYPVLPMAITADAIIAVSIPEESALVSDDSFQISISNVLADKFPSHQFKIPYGMVDVDATKHEWTNYFKCGLRGALEYLTKKHGDSFRPQSMNVLMDGTVPAGGGLSSSAAFVSASALAVLVANGEKDIDKTALTELAIVSERAVGVNSGGMDQSASVLSLRGSALYVSFVPSLTARAVQFPKTDPELSFLIANSFVTSDKHVTAVLHAILNDTSTPLPADDGPLEVSLWGFHSAYFQKHKTETFLEAQISELVTLTKKTLSKEEGYTRDEVSKILGMSVTDLEHRFTSKFPVRAERFMLRQRTLHVFTEALRVSKFISLLEKPSQSADHDTKSTESYNQQLGDLMNETQDSCRDLYACSCPELDQLCQIARRAGSYGSRLTGAGWGGCSVHLVPADKIDAIRAAWEKEYYSKLNLTAEQKEAAVVVSRPGGGSAVWKDDGSGI